jgi:large subunit ribosomal protein L30
MRGFRLEPEEGDMAKKSKGTTATTKRVKITLVKSTIGFNRDQAKVVQGMGLRRIGHTVELADTPASRGMIHKVRHLVTVE